MATVYGKRVCLAGPITGMADLNAAAFAVAQVRLKALGATFVRNPLDSYTHVRSCEAAAKTHADYMADSLHELTSRKPLDQIWRPVMPLKYHMLVLLPGWPDSKGARIERDVAAALEMEVCTIEQVEGYATEIDYQCKG